MTMRVKGGQQLAQFLEQLPRDIQQKAMRRAILRAANVVRDEARLRAPKKTGRLARSVKTTTRTDGTAVKGIVRLRGKNSYLGLWMEYGTAPHYIGKANGMSARLLTKKAKREGTLGQKRLKVNGKFVNVVFHPGVRPRPFMRPALAAKQREAIQVFGDYIASYLQIGQIQAPGIEVDEAA